MAQHSHVKAFFQRTLGRLAVILLLFALAGGFNGCRSCGPGISNFLQIRLPDNAPVDSFYKRAWAPVGKSDFALGQFLLFPVPIDTDTLTLFLQRFNGQIDAIHLRYTRVRFRSDCDELNVACRNFNGSKLVGISQLEPDTVNLLDIHIGNQYTLTPIL